MDSVLDWDGYEGLGIIGTNARKNLPKDIELIYFHKEKKNTIMKHSNAARSFDTSVAVNNSCRGFQHVHVSFQSI